jgi:predicted enzyme related to lactoylglutathione lyase
LTPVPLAAVVYAKDLDRLAAFYRTLLGWEVLEARAGEFVCLAPPDGSVELTVVAGHGVTAADPPTRRTTTAVKCSFSVDDLVAARARAAELGGLVDPSATEWTWREMVHCDGHDVEGNVFQLRVAVQD